jgi:hypothetical protein
MEPAIAMGQDKQSMLRAAFKAACKNKNHVPRNFKGISDTTECKVCGMELSFKAWRRNQPLQDCPGSQGDEQ